MAIAPVTRRHAAMWPGSGKRGSGTARRQSAVRRGQRGAKLQPGGRRRRSGGRIIGTAPPANGTRFAVIDFPPGNQPRMHRTETIDYVIVLEGEIEMDMDDSTVKMKAGDVMVQRGTNHAWANRSNRRARVAFVLIDAAPLGIGHPITGVVNARRPRKRTGTKGDASAE